MIFRRIMIGVLAALTAGSALGKADDPYLWLEEVEGEEALGWVESQNEQSIDYLESLPTFDELYGRNLEILNSNERIAAPSILGDHVYNFWRDAANQRGLWRRTSIDDYLTGDPAWETVLDIDALAEKEGEDWVYKGSTCLRPDYRRCLLRLSRGGADAVVVREFDVDAGAFVKGGFYVPEAKTGVGWVDRDTVFIGSDFGDGTLTDSGYARTARMWRRGEPLADAEEIFAGKSSDVSVGVSRTWDGDAHYDIARRSPTFFTRELYLMVEDGERVRIDIPDDASLRGIFHGQLIVSLKSDWTPANKTFAGGSLIGIDFERFMKGHRDFDELFAPTATSALGSVASTKDYLLLTVLEDVVSRMARLTRLDGAWVSEDLDTEPYGRISISTASDTTNTFFFSYEGFLQPDTLYVAREGGDDIEAMQSLPEFFDTEGMSVEQRFATSSDGEKIPYFLVLPPDFEPTGDTPTLLYGYGGFRVSMAPSYSAIVGHSWLARGGAFVVANIRGGGEYGPRWHQAALKENRQRAYDDFIAVAEDLIDRGVTSPDHLGIRGGSNGGLLTGVMLTQRPDLWNAVIVQVPLLDMKRFNRLLAGASWMAEYGNPDTDDWDYIKQYSPYHNLRRDADYPKAFFTTSTRDDRVHPGHARKMVARMDEMGHPVLYFENTVGGHAGASDNTQAARNDAFIYSYLWDQLGHQ